jgi:hypothetical protein
MKRTFLISLQEKFARMSKKPWANFETTGPDQEGRVGFSISWNKAFINNLHAMGMQGINDEETVQMFFLSARMVPEEMVKDVETVNPAEMPGLTNEANTLRR